MGDAVVTRLNGKTIPTPPVAWDGDQPAGREVMIVHEELKRRPLRAVAERRGL
jgi:hypothetical protein